MNPTQTSFGSEMGTSGPATSLENRLSHPLQLARLGRYGRLRQSRVRGRRRGAALIFVGVGMVVFLMCCALVVDYGALVRDANQLQRGCDAAALAGASQLQGGATGNPDQERQRAQDLSIQVAGENNITIPTNGNSSQSPDIWFDDNGHPTQVTVRATSTQGFLYGLIARYPNGKVTRQATARIGPCNSAPPNPRIVPLGITQGTFDAYSKDGINNVGKPNPKFETFTLIGANKTVFGQDDLVAFDMRGPDSKSPSHFEAQLVGNEVAGRDYPNPTLNPVTYETTLNASMNPQGARLEDGLGQLFTSSQDQPWNDAPIADIANPWATPGQRYSDILNGNSPLDAQGNPNPRIMNLIVTPPNSNIVVGTDNLQIVGYAPVYVQQVTEDPNTGAVTVTVGFLPGSTVSSAACGGASTGTITGNRAVSLIG